MPKAPLTEKAMALLKRPNPAVIAVLRPDGQPISVATWYLVEDDGRILVNMDGGRKRLDYMRDDPRISLTALEDGAWYTHISVQGRITQWRDDPDLADIDLAVEALRREPLRQPDQPSRERPDRDRLLARLGQSRDRQVAVTAPASPAAVRRLRGLVGSARSGPRPGP